MLCRELRLCKEGGSFGADDLSVLLANMSGQNARFEGEIYRIESDSSADNTISERDCPEDHSISSSLRRYRFLLNPFVQSFQSQSTSALPRDGSDISRRRIWQTSFFQPWRIAG